MKNFLHKLAQHYGIILVCLISFLLLLFTLIIDQNLIIQIHDNLDNAVYSIFFSNPAFFSFNDTLPILGGLSRALLVSSLNLTGIIFYLFNPFVAYIVNYFLKVTIGTLSFYLLLKELTNKSEFEKLKNLIWIISFAFGLLPAYPQSYIASASLPLVIFLILRIYKYDDKINYIYLLFYPILSHFSFYGIFIIGYITILATFDLIKNRSYRLFIAAIILLFGYILVDFRLLYSMFFSDELTIKSLIRAKTIYFSQVYKVFTEGIYHSESLHKNIILPLSACYIVIHNFFNVYKKRLFFSIPNIIFLFLILNTLVYWAYYTESIVNKLWVLIPQLKGVNLGRILFLNPLLWYLMFYYIIKELYFRLNFTAVFFVVFQLAIVIYSPVLYNDIRPNIDRYLFNKTSTSKSLYTFSEFYSESLFDTIKDDIGYNGEYSVAFRFHPSILSYNNISTLDGYLTFYPISYHAQFRDIILPELSLNESNMNYYDNWGGRAYLFSSEHTISKQFNYYNINDLLGDSQEELVINNELFVESGGVYIFSNGKITNYESQEMIFINKYTDNKSLYSIYVYKVEPCS